MIDGIDGLKDARDQLTLILSFFPRVDAKLSTVLAVNTGMFATLAASTPPFQALTVWSGLAAVTTAGILACSFTFLYFGAFPNVKGGHSSVVFFRDIGARNESRFLEDYHRQSVESLTKDVLSQVWRNSEILNVKFRSLKVAFIAMAFAIVPWAISLALFAVQRASLRVVVSH